MNINLKIKFVTPQSREELAEHQEDIAFLSNFLQRETSQDGLYHHCLSRVPNTTFVYVNNVLLGAFIIEFFKKTAQLHGICRPDAGKIFPRVSRLKLWIYQKIFEEVFLKQNKEKVIIKAFPENRTVKAFAQMYGFVRLNNMDKGRLVWRLTKANYLRGQESVRRNTGSKV